MLRAVHTTPEVRDKGSTSKPAWPLKKYFEKLRRHTSMRRPMICTQPRVHAVKVAITDDKDNVLGPVRIFCGHNSYQ